MSELFDDFRNEEDKAFNVLDRCIEKAGQMFTQAEVNEKLAGLRKLRKAKFMVGDTVRDTHGHVKAARVIAVHTSFFYDIRVTEAGSDFAKKGEMIGGYSEDELRVKREHREQPCKAK